MSTAAILSPADLESAFRRALARKHVPHQSHNARFPGASIAARDLGVHRGHLHRVLTGERESKTLLKRWDAWLKKHPEFAQLQHR